jgi:hypothetical protein
MKNFILFCWRLMRANEYEVHDIYERDLEKRYGYQAHVIEHP